MHLDVVIVSEINVDVVATGLTNPPAVGGEQFIDDVTLTAGSSGVLTASGLAALGSRVGLCGLVGDDLFGRYMLNYLDGQGINHTGVVIDPKERTGASVVLSTPRDRAILTFRGSMSHFGLHDVRFDVVACARHLHLSSYFLQSALRADVSALMTRAHALGLTTSADTGHDPHQAWEVEDLWDGLDILLVNEVEACAISGAMDAAAALEWLVARVPTVIVKCGAAGALAARGPERVAMPSFAVEVVDTTGAGDAFDAGFLAGMIGGENLEACVRRGNACGALAAAHVGGAGGIDAARVAQMIDDGDTARNDQPPLQEWHA
jgi:sugar/nucleoside kinase (ribokinase family)